MDVAGTEGIAEVNECRINENILFGSVEKILQSKSIKLDHFTKEKYIYYLLGRLSFLILMCAWSFYNCKIIFIT